MTLSGASGIQAGLAASTHGFTARGQHEAGLTYLCQPFCQETDLSCGRRIQIYTGMPVGQAENNGLPQSLHNQIG